MAKISVFGIGYTGTVSAACLADQKHEVVAVDIDPAKVEAINAGRTPIVEDGLGELVARNRTAGRLSATTDIAAAFAGTDLSIICVGTPGEADGAIGLSQVRALSATIGAALAEKTGFHRVMT